LVVLITRSLTTEDSRLIDVTRKNLRELNTKLEVSTKNELASYPSCLCSIILAKERKREILLLKVEPLITPEILLVTVNGSSNSEEEQVSNFLNKNSVRKIVIPLDLIAGGL
jgi:hypothetical protein